MEEEIIKAGQIAKQTKELAKKIIKKDTPLIEIAEKIENKIIESGGKPAFPVNLSINEIAAHYTPPHNDKTLASGLLKIDLGVHVDGWIADTAFSIDLENNKENKKLIQTTEEALENAINIANNQPISKIGQTIETTIKKQGFSPVINLTGHCMEKYELHTDPTIPNIKNNKQETIGNKLCAIEPFATTGNGKVRDGKPSGIYLLMDTKNPRNPETRKMLQFIINEYKTLPFCSRWLTKKFGIKTPFSLKELEQNKNIYQFPQLIEISNKKVAQSEHTILIKENKTRIIT